MGMTNNGLSSWQAESEGTELLDTTIAGSGGAVSLLIGRWCNP